MDEEKPDYYKEVTGFVVQTHAGGIVLTLPGSVSFELPFDVDTARELAAAMHEAVQHLSA